MSQMIKKMTLLMQLEDWQQPARARKASTCARLLQQSHAEKRHPVCGKARAWSSCRRTTGYGAGLDAFLIENVLTNYLSNALHHVRDGGGISGTIRRAGDDRVRISIYNDGDLIPPDDLARIWESFYKVDKARTRAYGGTGIGLSVVAAIMRAHGMPYGVFNRRDGEKNRRGILYRAGTGGARRRRISE